MIRVQVARTSLENLQDVPCNLATISQPGRLPASGNVDLCAFVDEAPGDGVADSAGAASDDGDFRVEFLHGWLLTSVGEIGCRVVRHRTSVEGCCYITDERCLSKFANRAQHL